MSQSRRASTWFGKGLPKISLNGLTGKLIVVEGQDGAGRSTHVALLRAWLENLGYPTSEVGLKRSRLAGKELQEEMKHHALAPTTMSLFYATDLADQIQNVIIPSMKAGFIVVADRYIYTLIARAIVRGQSRDWIEKVYGFALKPDAVLYMRASPQTLADRSFFKDGTLNFWESGQDIEGGGDIYLRFIRYQTKLGKIFDGLAKDFHMSVIDADDSERAIQESLQKAVKKALKIGVKKS